MRTHIGSRAVAVIIVVWLLIGLAAAAQRNYLSGSSTSCARIGTTLVTVVAGPLNYIGANPKVGCPTPRPSR